MNEPLKVEYRVIQVTRFVVTRYEDRGHTGSVSEKGEYGNAHMAHEVAYALAKEEHQRLGWGPGDERIQYPQYDPPTEVGQSCATAGALANVEAADRAYREAPRDGARCAA
jgi:hypothetical protein